MQEANKPLDSGGARVFLQFDFTNCRIEPPLGKSVARILVGEPDVCWWLLDRLSYLMRRDLWKVQDPLLP